MKNVSFDNEKITIVEEKKTLFSKKIVNTEIPVESIREVNREEFKGNLNSMTIFFGKNDFMSMTLEECSNLEELFQFLVELRDSGKTFKIILFDIETVQSKEI